MRIPGDESGRAGRLIRSVLVFLVLLAAACSQNATLPGEADHSAAPTHADAGTDTSASSSRVDSDGPKVPHGETLTGLSYRPEASPGETAPGSPSERAGSIARRYLQERGERFGLAAGKLSELSLTSVEPMPTGYRVNFVQTRRGLPVFNGGIRIVLDRSFRVTVVHNRYVPDQGRSAQPGLDSEGVERTLEEWVTENPSKGLPSTPISVRGLEPGYWFDGETTHLVYRVRLVGGEASRPYQILIDATSGNVLRQKKLFRSKAADS